MSPPHAQLRPQLLALLRAKQAIAAASKANASANQQRRANAKSSGSQAVSATAPRAATQNAGERKPTVKVCMVQTRESTRAESCRRDHSATVS